MLKIITGAGPAGADWNSAGVVRFVIAGRAAATPVKQREFGVAKNAEAPLTVANQASRRSIPRHQRNRGFAFDCLGLGARPPAPLSADDVTGGK